MRPSLLLISHAYAALENRKKLQALAAHVDLVCVTSVIETHAVLGRSAADFDNESDAPSRRYELIRLPRLGHGITTFIYRGLGNIMRSRRFDVLLVENEPWAFVRWQSRLLAGLHQREALFGEFTWENVPRPGWKGTVLSLVYRAAAASTDFVIAGNQAAGKLFGISEEHLLVAPQIGVDLENHQPATPAARNTLREACGLPRDAIVVGYCGRFAEEKGLRELVQASEEVGGLHLTMLGSGALESWLREEASKKPWLHLLPPRTHSEIPDFLRCLDVFVLASKPVRSMKLCWEEQFGHVLIEAMACGVATLGARSGAIPEVLADDAALFPSGDATTLAQRLREVKQGSDLATRQLQRVRDLFTHEAVASRWAGFIISKLHA
jgi:glycosyltransferase involved in cell wall biosynthesis